MSEKILVPVLGESITEATVAKWLKQEGDTVAAALFKMQFLRGSTILLPIMVYFGLLPFPLLAPLIKK